jgi:hypothetical protein
MPSPRLLLLDIETAPALALVWGLHDQNIGIDQIVKPSRVLCWSAKWHGEKEVHYCDERGGKKKMFLAMRQLMLEADAVVTYNGNHFDLQKLNGEFVFHRIPPAPPITSIDLFKTVKGLGWISGKLAFVGPFLNIGQKVKHEGFSLWSACLNGDQAAWSRMAAYNKQDTQLLEGLYDILRPYIKNHPHLGPPRGRSSCPKCRSTRNVKAGKPRYTKNLIIERLECTKCGGWFDGQQQRALAA